MEEMTREPQRRPGLSDSHTAARSGRATEVLVAHLERVLAPFGAQVTSPDRLRDRASGRYREVDVTIRAALGSAEVLIIVECRDWSRKQGVQWVEQLIGKRDGVGADLALAVSTSGFTDSALARALEARVRTRTLTTLTRADALELVADAASAAGDEPEWPWLDLAMAMELVEMRFRMDPPVQAPSSFRPCFRCESAFPGSFFGLDVLVQLSRGFMSFVTSAMAYDEGSAIRVRVTMHTNDRVLQIGFDKESTKAGVVYQLDDLAVILDIKLVRRPNEGSNEAFLYSGVQTIAVAERLVADDPHAWCYLIRLRDGSLYHAGPGTGFIPEDQYPFDATFELLTRL